MDIIGFNEQIGLTKAVRKIVTMSKNMAVAPVAVKKQTTMAIKKPSVFSTAMAKAKAIAPVVAKKAATMPLKKQSILDKAKITTALVKAKQTGKPVVFQTPAGAKKFTPKTATPFNLVPTASRTIQPTIKPVALQPTALPMAPAKTEIQKFEQSMQNLPAAKQAEAIFNLPPTPAIVQNLTPIQQSFLKTDLPYQVISKNNFGQPKTKFLKNTPLKFDISIDQIQPPVDAGMSNYYGK